MSKVKWTAPAHIPKLKEYRISGPELRARYEQLGVAIPFPIADHWYYHTDVTGWASLVRHLVIKSSLYKPDKRDCDFYAKKAKVTCEELFSLNAIFESYGRSPLGPHMFDSFFDGDVIWLLEPNEGFADERGTWQDLWGYLDGDLVFPWDANGYSCTHVLL